MFDTVRNNRRLVQVFLALITLPFAFWGVDSYVRDNATGDSLAKVGDSKIGAQEFQQAMREQQERMRPALGGKVDPAMLDNPEMRRAVLGGLINQRLLGMHASKSKLTVSDSQLVQFITSAPALQENGQFSPQRYATMVASQGMSKEMFEARVRQDLAMQQALTAVSSASLPGRAATDRWLAAQLEEREIAELMLQPDAYVSQVKLSADAVKTFYEANRKQFEIPEQVRAEFVALSLEKMAAQLVPSEAEIQAWYQAHPESYRQTEERRASHILITAPKDAPEAQDKAARARAEEVLAQLQKTPADFAKLAKQHSQDPGSAERGGDLDWFGRGMMVPPFEQAAYALKENELSGLVRSDFGYHIIKLTGIRPEKVRPFDTVKAEIAAELKRQGAAKKYAEMAEGFTNTVYEQADSLAPAAEKYQLKIQTTDWITRAGQALPPFTNPKLMAAVFSDEAIKNKRNTEAVEVAPSTLVAARVVEHKPAALQPLAAVAASIERLLVRQEAAKLAAADGAAKLARLAKGEKLDLAWASLRTVARSYAPNLAPEAVRAVFAADAAKLPAYAGTPVPGGYALYRVSQVKPYVPAAGGEEPPRAKALRQEYARIVGEEEFAAWLTTLRERFPVDINAAALEVKERQ
jgi:peptidyl-prolyl cis-trans isomerase D